MAQHRQIQESVHVRNNSCFIILNNINDPLKQDVLMTKSKRKILQQKITIKRGGGLVFGIAFLKC